MEAVNDLLYCLAVPAFNGAAQLYVAYDMTFQVSRFVSIDFWLYSGDTDIFKEFVQCTEEYHKDSQSTNHEHVLQYWYLLILLNSSWVNTIFLSLCLVRSIKL